MSETRIEIVTDDLTLENLHELCQKYPPLLVSRSVHLSLNPSSKVMDFHYVLFDFHVIYYCKSGCIKFRFPGGSVFDLSHMGGPFDTLLLNPSSKLMGVHHVSLIFISFIIVKVII